MRVVIADDEPLARERLRSLLAAQDGVDVVAEAGNGEQALHACAELQPDLVLLDIAMPGLDGLEAARHLASFEPRPAVVFCTAYDAHALSAFEAAAIDYLMKPVRAERLAAAIARARTFLAGRDGQPQAHSGQQARSVLCARLRGSLRLGGIVDIGTQCALVRLASGNFVFLDSYPLTDAIRAQVDALTDGGTKVEAILNLHPFHTLHCEWMHSAFPQAKLYGTARHVDHLDRKSVV